MRLGASNLLFYLSALISSAVSVSPLKRASPSDIEALITQLTNDAIIASAGLVNFPATGGTLAGALALHTALITLNSDIEGGIVILFGSAALAEEDGLVIVNGANNELTPAIIGVYSGIESFESKNVTLPVGGFNTFVRGEASTLDTDSSGFYNALKGLLPASIQGVLKFPNPPVQPGDPTA